MSPWRSFGVAYPTTEVAGDPDDIRKFAWAAEDLGYRHLMAYDHVVKCPHEGREPKLTRPYTEKDPFHDPFVLFALAAAVKDKLNFVTETVLVFPQRQTALVAQKVNLGYSEAGTVEGPLLSFDRVSGNMRAQCLFSLSAKPVKPLGLPPQATALAQDNDGSPQSMPAYSALYLRL